MSSHERAIAWADRSAGAPTVEAAQLGMEIGEPHDISAMEVSRRLGAALTQAKAELYEEEHTW